MRQPTALNFLASDVCSVDPFEKLQYSIFSQSTYRCSVPPLLENDRPSQFIYWDDIPARRLRPETLDREAALERAKAVARAARQGTGGC